MKNAMINLLFIPKNPINQRDFGVGILFLFFCLTMLYGHNMFHQYQKDVYTAMLAGTADSNALLDWYFNFFQFAAIPLNLFLTLCPIILVYKRTMALNMKMPARIAMGIPVFLFFRSLSTVSLIPIRESVPALEADPFQSGPVMITIFSFLGGLAVILFLILKKSSVQNSINMNVESNGLTSYGFLKRFMQLVLLFAAVTAFVMALEIFFINPVPIELAVQTEEFPSPLTKWILTLLLAVFIVYQLIFISNRLKQAGHKGSNGVILFLAVNAALAGVLFFYPSMEDPMGRLLLNLSGFILFTLSIAMFFAFIFLPGSEERPAQQASPGHSFSHAG